MMNLGSAENIFTPICNRWHEFVAGLQDIGICLGVQRKWNEIQNTSKDIKLLANFLLLQYRAGVMNRTA